MSRRTLKTVLVIVIAGLLVLVGVEYVMLRRLTKQTIPPRSADAGMLLGVDGDIGDAESASEPKPGTELLAWEPYTLPVSLGDLGPRLIASEAIDLERYVALYEQNANPLTLQQVALLTEGSEANLVLSRENADFLLNLLWGMGLTNANPILARGPMVTVGDGEIGGYASTAGWTIGRQASVVLYASEELITLTPEQQTRLENVAGAVYRPCCNNPTTFPDCNHGMAMLGLLELMSAADETEEAMFEAAKAANTFWFPRQTRELRLYAEHALDTSWDDVDARAAVGAELASGTGFQSVHQWLGLQGLLQQGPAGGSGCGL